VVASSSHQLDLVQDIDSVISNKDVEWSLFEWVSLHLVIRLNSTYKTNRQTK